MFAMKSLKFCIYRKDRDLFLACMKNNSKFPVMDSSQMTPNEKLFQYN